MATIAGHAYIPVEADMAGFQKQMQTGIRGAISSASTSLQTAGKSMFRSGAVITAGISAPIVAGFKSAIDSASDLSENLSKVHAVFGDASGEIEKFAQGAARGVGLSQSAALEATGTFGNMFAQLGIGAEQTAAMSTEMVTLAADFASFHNADITDVIDAQSAAFRGEYDALQRYVPTINAAAVEQKALAMTGKSTTKELTAQDKALAAQTFMLENAGDAMGDFARTSDGAANKQRILKAQMSDAAATLGQQLMPHFTKLLEWVQKAVTWFSNLGQPMQGIILGFGALLAVAGPLVAVVGALVTVVGVLISPVALVIAGVAALAAGVFFAYQRFEGFRSAVDAVVQWLLGTAWPMVQSFADFIVAKFTELVGWVQSNWAAIQEAISHVINVVSGIIRTAIDVLSALWRAWGDDLLAMAQAVWGFIQSTIDNAIRFVQSVIQTALAVINGDWGKAWDGIKGILSAVWDQIKNIVSTAINLVKSTIGGVLSSIGEVWRGAWDGMKSALSGAWDGIKTLVSGGIDAIVGFVAGLPGRVSSIASGAFNSLKNAFRGAINFIIDGWNGLEFSIPGFDPPGPGPSFGGFTLGVPNIPRLHTGGVVTADMPATPGLAADERQAILQIGERVLPADAAPDPDEWGRRAADAYADRLRMLMRSA